jgi:transposase, IS5 family
MKQISLATSGYELITKRTRKRVFLEEMNLVVPWTELVGLIQPHASPEPTAKGGRPAFRIETMLRIHFLQQWFGLSDPAMEEALHDIVLYCQFAQLDPGATRLPDETTILRFRHLLEANNLGLQIMATINATLAAKGLTLKSGTVVDATLIAAPPSTKNKDGTRDPQMHSSKKGNNYHFGMKAHIGVDVDSGLVHTVHTTAGNEHDVTQASKLLHGQESTVYGDSGYRGVEKREEIQKLDNQPDWEISMMPSKRNALKAIKDSCPLAATLDKIEKLKAGIRAKVEHPFRVLKCQFGYRKTRYKGLAKNTAQITTLFALVNLWMARKNLMGTEA